MSDRSSIIHKWNELQFSVYLEQSKEGQLLCCVRRRSRILFFVKPNKFSLNFIFGYFFNLMRLACTDIFFNKMLILFF